MFRHLLAALCCAVSTVSIAQSFDPAPNSAYSSLRLRDLSFSAVSLAAPGSPAALTLLNQGDEIMATVWGSERGLGEMNGTYGGPLSVVLIGDSPRMDAAAGVAAHWNTVFDDGLYDLHADVAIQDSQSEWNWTIVGMWSSAYVNAAPQSAITVSGHLFGSQATAAIDGSPETKGRFTASLDGAEYQREFGSAKDALGLDEYFSLTVYNRTDSEQDYYWFISAEAEVSRIAPAVPEPSGLAMVLAGALTLSIPHAACALRRQRTRGKYRPAPLR